MARPQKEGLDYFPLDVKQDDKVSYIEAKHGLIGYAVVVKLWQKIYSTEGYYAVWNERIKYLFARELCIELSAINEVLETAFEDGLFSRPMYEEHGILTSRGVQKRYVNIISLSRIKGKNIDEKHSLLGVNSQKQGVNVQKPLVNVQKQGVNAESSTQTKIKEIKGKESKGNKEGLVLNFSFQMFWDGYEKKVGDLEKLKKKWSGLTEEERAAAMAYIPDYKLAQPDKAFRKNPETFLNNKSWKDELIKKQAPGANLNVTTPLGKGQQILSEYERSMEALKLKYQDEQQPTY